MSNDRLPGHVRNGAMRAGSQNSSLRNLGYVIPVKEKRKSTDGIGECYFCFEFLLTTMTADKPITGIHQSSGSRILSSGEKFGRKSYL